MIRTDEAERYEASIQPPTPPVIEPPIIDPPIIDPPIINPPIYPKVKKGHFYGRVDLNPVKAKMDFGQIVDEVVEHFTARHGTAVRITVEIEADDAQGFDEAVQRAVRENCSTLKFGSHSFE